MKTPNMADENLKKLMDLFPNIVTETIGEDGNVVRAIDKDKLEQEISTKVIDGKTERYEFTWPEKKNSIITANAPTTNTLRPCVEDSVNFDTTKNLYIEGDNLEILKILQETYLGKVQMIYIDPPYNTGKDFVYEDDFAEDMDEYMDKSGQFDEEGNQLVVNKESNGRFHTDWLNMMYPRLKIARNFLSDDGVIFISIDDNEHANLKKICDEVFGESNFIGEYIKQSKVGGGNDSKFIVKEHEYCLCYSKNIEKTFEMNINHSDDYLKRYKEEDECGRYFWDTFARPGLGLQSTLTYDIEMPDGTNYKTRWIRSKDRFKKEYSEGKIRIIRTRDNKWSVQFKQYLNKKGKTPRSMTMDFGGTTDGDKEIKQIFGKKVFDYPKSVKYLSTLLSTITDKNITVMDFFSGSATTAHAVMQLNAEDSGNRQFIMVQLQEETDEKSEAYKAGYKNICEIGKERIRRAGKKIQEDFKDKEGIEDLDTGFRVLKLDSSNMEDVYYNPLELQQDMLSSMRENIKKDRNDLDLLFQVMLDLGIEISSKIDEFSVEGKRCYSVEDGFLIACFDENIDTDLIKEIARKKPYYAVITDRSMHDDSLLTNFEQIFKEISPDTVRRVL